MTAALQIHSMPPSASLIRTSSQQARSQAADEPQRVADASDATAATVPKGLDFAAMVAVLALAFEVQQQARSNAKQRCADFARLIQQQSIVQKNAQVSSGNKELGAAIGNLAVAGCMLGVGATMQWRGAQPNRFAPASPELGDAMKSRPVSATPDSTRITPKLMSEADDMPPSLPPRSTTQSDVVHHADSAAPSRSATARKGVSDVVEDTERASAQKTADAHRAQAPGADEPETVSAQSPASQQNAPQDAREAASKLREQQFAQEHLRLQKLAIAGQGFTSAAIVAGGVASASAQVSATQDRAEATFTKTSEDSLQATTASLNDNARVVQDGAAQTLATLSEMFRSFENTARSIAGHL